MVTVVSERHLNERRRQSTKVSSLVPIARNVPQRCAEEFQVDECQQSASVLAAMSAEVYRGDMANRTLMDGYRSNGNSW